MAGVNPSLSDGSYGLVDHCIVLEENDFLMNFRSKIKGGGGFCPPCLTLATALKTGLVRFPDFTVRPKY